MRGATKTTDAAELQRFRPYAAYKDSGVEWLGQIPSHWKVSRLKHIAALNPESLGENTDPTREMVYVDIGGVDGLGRIIDKEQLTFASAPSRARRLVREGDVIVSTVRTYLRAIASIRNPEPSMVVSTGFAVVRPANGLISDYAAYALRAPYFVERVVASSKGVSFPAINESEMAIFELALPTESEQRAIARFLDRETAKIDALIAKKERLIELLQQERVALITRTVTKGLTPNAPTRDSGIEWLGEIPAHWTTTVLKRIGDLQGGAGFPEDEQGLQQESIPFFKVGDMGSAGNERELIDAPNTISNITARRLRAFVFPTRTIVFAKVGAALLLNRRRILARPSCIDNNMMGFIPLRCNYLWSFYWLSGLDLREIANPGAVPSVNEGQMRNTPVALPSDEEQQAISSFLDRETARIDAAIGKIRRAIHRLSEMRTALISAAVTGKINVREAA